MAKRSRTIWMIVIAAMLALLGPLVQKSRGDFSLSDDQQLTVNSHHTYGILYDISRVFIVSGGTISSFLQAWDSSTANISDGYVSSLSAWNSSIVGISGGTVRDISADNFSSINISGGTISENFNTFNSSTVDISGGTISYFLGARNSSSVDISGGFVSYLYTEDNSTVDISGGSVLSLYNINSSVVTFYGQNFSVSGGLVLDGERVLGSGILSGEWMDGSPWSVNILSNKDPEATIMAVVPVPPAIILGSLGITFTGWLLRRRRML